MRKKYLVLFFFFAIVGFSVPLPEDHHVDSSFISGSAFRLYSDYVYDEIDDSLDPTTVAPGSTVFVQANCLRLFFEKVHPEIPYKYILITHNHDAAVPGQFSQYLDDPKIIAWFGENWDGTSHYKMHPIPMGMANSTWPNGNEEGIRKVEELHLKKEHLAHMSFTIQTFYKERWGVFRLFSLSPFVYRTIKKPFEQYLLDVAASKFEIAPKGAAWDTYRLWECLYVGTFPVVKTSPLDVLYEDLPVLIVQSWEEVTEDFLNQKYVEMHRKTYKFEKMYMKYWIDLIDSYKTRL